jgi:iron complex transport system permease protein
MVPHVVRWFVGPDQRWIIPLTMIYAPVLLLSADIAGRLILFPGELEAGIMSGAIFQSLTRNPLGSPDIIGFSAGSYTGALVVMLLLSGGYYETAAGALNGGIITAMAVYLLAYRRGVQGFRLIIVGIGVAAMLSAFNTWMIREADLQVAMSAAIWGAGSLNGPGFEQLLPVVIVLCLVSPPALFLSRPMRQLEVGDDMARASGVNAN